MKRSILFYVTAISLSVLMSTGCRFVSANSKKYAQNRGESGVLALDRTNSDIVTCDYEGSAFDAVHCKGAYDVSYTVGECKVTVSAPSGLISHLTVDISDGVLTIGPDVANIQNWKNVKVLVSSPTLSCLKIQGAVDFKAEKVSGGSGFELRIEGAGDVDIDRLDAGDVSVYVAGAGDIEIDGILCDTLNAQADGASDMEISGKAGHARFELNGAANLDIRGLKCPDIVYEKHGIARIRK